MLRGSNGELRDKATVEYEHASTDLGSTSYLSNRRGQRSTVRVKQEVVLEETNKPGTKQPNIRVRVRALIVTAVTTTMPASTKGALTLNRRLSTGFNIMLSLKLAEIHLGL